jgi:DNA adenine methylase
MSIALTQPIKWHGGKHYLAPWIISHMPKHAHYVEPFFGGGSVLLQKDPENVSEVANDLNGWLTCFWRVLADPALFDLFHRQVAATPLSEQLWLEASESVSGEFVPTSDDVSAAVAFFICARQSRQGLMRDFATLSRNRTRRGMNEQASSWLTSVDGLPEIHARLRRVVILNRPAIKVIEQQDGQNTLFYLDPPYLHETRSTTDEYAHEMTTADHAALLDALADVEGKFLLSGYPSALYADAAKRCGWHCVTKAIDNKASSAATKEVKTECLWANYPLGATP